MGNYFVNNGKNAAEQPGKMLKLYSNKALPYQQFIYSLIIHEIIGQSCQP